MDQTINEMVYGGRINATVRSWNDQANGNVGESGLILGQDGTSFKKVNGRLVQMHDPKMLKRLARLEKKLAADGLVKKDEATCESVSIAESSELVAEL